MQDPKPPPCCEIEYLEPEPLSEERLAQIAKALAHPVRVMIIEQFAECRPHTTQEIVDGFDLAQSTISEHLRILREAGLIKATKDGPRTWHCVRPEVIRRFAFAAYDLARS